MPNIIKEYNGKVWYRLLKVAYLLCLITVLAWVNFSWITSDTTKINSNKSYIKCLQNSKIIKVTSKYFDDGVIAKKCYGVDIPEKMIYASSLSTYSLKVTSQEEVTRKEVLQKFENYKYSNGLSETNTPLDLDRPLFMVNLVYSHWQGVVAIIIANGLILFLFEVVRRAYYYVHFGSMRP